MPAKSTTKRARQDSGSKRVWNRLDRSQPENMELGLLLRKLREDQGWSIGKLSGMTGLAASTISRIENNKMSPTFDVFVQLTRGLQQNPHEILASMKRQKSRNRLVSLVRKGQAKVTDLAEVTYEMRHTDLNWASFTPSVLTVKANSTVESRNLQGHSGEEFCYVQEGKIEILLKNRKSLTLGPGDSVYLDSEIPHRYRCASKTDATILMVSTVIGKPELAGWEP